MILISLIAAGLAAGQPAAAPQAGAMMMAQANDRCLTTYAVRLTRTTATDEEIYVQATAGCKAVRDQLAIAIAADYPPADAARLNAMLDTQSKPTFLKLLARIRADRLLRAGG